MKHLWTAILFTVIFLSAYSQMTGVWLIDYQNNGFAACTPESFTINKTTQNNYTITYNYPEIILELFCPYNFTGNYTSNLTQNMTTGVWVDGKGQQLIYNSSLETIQYLPTNGSHFLLFDRTGSYIAQESIFPYIGGNWINPKQINNASCSCAPPSVVITADIGSTSIQYYISSNCSGQASGYAYFGAASTSKLNWTDTNSKSKSNYSYLFDPSTPDNLTVQVNGCQYTYQKDTDFKLLFGTWFLDWQSTLYQDFSPSMYQVTINDNSYMTSNATYADSSSENYVIGLYQNQYFDAGGLNLTYDAGTDTLMCVDESNFTILLSRNGSLFPNNVVDSYWITPQGTDGSVLPEYCCAPDYISISANSYFNTFVADYYFASDYENNPGCQNISQYISQYTPGSTVGTMVTIFQINTPSITQVIWTDEYSNQMQFPTSSEIIVQNFFNQCSFTMKFTSTRPHLSATLISQGILSLVVAFLTVMICI